MVSVEPAHQGRNARRFSEKDSSMSVPTAPVTVRIVSTDIGKMRVASRTIQKIDAGEGPPR